MRSVVRDLAILAVLGGVVLFTNLGGPRLWDRDEPRNAGCAAEMRARGDWVTPWFNDELRTHKPVLLYWLILSAYAVLGVNEFSARFWSAALGIGSVWLTYAMGRRLFGARVGFWAGLVLLTTLMFDVASRAATPDAALLFCVTLALTLFVVGEFPRLPESSSAVARDWRVPVRASTALGMYAAMGLAVLAKGPVGAILPTAVVGMFLLIARLPRPEPLEAETPAAGWRRALRLLRPFAPPHFLGTCVAMRPALAVAVILAVAAPWYVWVGMRTDGEFLNGFFWQHNFARAVQSFEGHRGGLWFYPVALAMGFFPWSVFAAPLGVDLVRRWRTAHAERAGLVFALCWVGVWVGLFSLARTKLPSYVTPSYPALALLTATFVVRWTDGSVVVGRFLALLPLIVLGAAGVGIAIGLPLAAHRYVPGAEWLGIVGLLPIGGASLAIGLRRRERPRQASLVLAGVAVALTTVLFGVVPQVVDRSQQSHVLLAAIDQYKNNPEVGALGGLEPSWVFYGKRPIQELTLASAAVNERGSRFAPRPIISVAEFLEGGENRVVIAHGRQLAALQDRFPGRLAILAEAPKFLKNERLVVVTLNEQLARRQAVERPLR